MKCRRDPPGCKGWDGVTGLGIEWNSPMWSPLRLDEHLAPPVSDGERNKDDAPVSAEDPDLRLVRLVGAGEEAAFRVLVDRHLDRLVRVAERLLSNRADAEEVAQEVFVRVWQHAARWESGNARYATWLHRVTVNLCQDRLRKRREVGVDELPETASAEPQPDAVLAQQSLAERVQAAINQLPERQRIAIILCHYEQLGNPEAAKIMEVSVEAVESLLARGRRTLKEVLAGEMAHIVGEEQ